MIALGLDPGPTTSGWAALQSQRPMARPRLLACGTVPSTGEGVTPLLAEWSATAGDETMVLALEVVEGYAHEPARSAALNATADIAGMVRGLALGLRIFVYRIPARRWRAALCGRSSPSDATIKQGLSVLVEDFPETSNVHERDAMGAAFAILQQRGVDRAMWEKAAAQTAPRRTK